MMQATYRMIAIDLDGTLLCPVGSVRPRVKAAVHRVLRAGALVCFATGRNQAESRAILQSVDHYAAAVFIGGALVVDTLHQVTLHRQLMQPQLAAEVSAALEELGHAVLALQDRASADVDYLITEGIELNEPTARWIALNELSSRRIPSLARHDHRHTARVSIVAPPEDTAEALDMLRQRFGQRIVYHNLITPNGLEVLEVFDPAVNKWEGIRHVASRHGIEPHQIIAIGDDLNDLPMIRHAGLGVAMGNARPEVKAVARRVIGGNDHDGLAVFLEDLLTSGQLAPVEPRHTDAAAQTRASPAPAPSC